MILCSHGLNAPLFNETVLFTQQSVCVCVFPSYAVLSCLHCEPALHTIMV